MSHPMTKTDPRREEIEAGARAMYNDIVLHRAGVPAPTLHWEDMPEPAKVLARTMVEAALCSIEKLRSSRPAPPDLHACRVGEEEIGQELRLWSVEHRQKCIEVDPAGNTYDEWWVVIRDRAEHSRHDDKLEASEEMYDALTRAILALRNPEREAAASAPGRPKVDASGILAADRTDQRPNKDGSSSLPAQATAVDTTKLNAGQLVQRIMRAIDTVNTASASELAEAIVADILDLPADYWQRPAPAAEVTREHRALALDAVEHILKMKRDGYCDDDCLSEGADVFLEVIEVLERPDCALMSSPSPVRPLVKEDAIDAARWRSLMSSQRLHCMGSAGFDKTKPRDGVCWHFGMEFWSTHPARNDPTYPDKFERELLTNYVDALAAAPQPDGGK